MGSANGEKCVVKNLNCGSLVDRFAMLWGQTKDKVDNLEKKLDHATEQFILEGRTLFMLKLKRSRSGQ